MARRSALLASAFTVLTAAGAGAQTLPIADAGDDQSFPCAPVTGALVTLDGSGSSDPDDPLAVLTYTWSGDAALGVGVTVDGVMPVVTLLPGVHVLTLTVDDGIDGTATDDVQVTVVADTEPPELVLDVPATAELWPPNHKYHSFTAADFVSSASDSCDVEVGPEDVIFTRGTSDEADNANGDGNTTGDIAFDTGCASALVRSERAGPGDGRVYELTLSLQDSAGNAAEGVLTVSVPHDRAHDAVDSGDASEVVADACGPLEMCPPAPDPACTEAPEAKVEIEVGGKDGGELRWRAQGFDAAEDAFSDPAADYQLCVYTDDGATPVLEDDPAAPHGAGWKHKKNGGAKFRGQKAGAMADLDGLKLSEKKGEGSLSVSASGDEVALPTLPIADGTALKLQLRSSAGICVGSTFDDPEVNDAERYSDENESE